jgi:hypothetical protein
MQTVYFGQTSASCPSKRLAQYDEAECLGFKFEPSKSGTYWSTQATMKSLVNNIIALYFDAKKGELGLPPMQCSFWTIDCWCQGTPVAYPPVTGQGCLNRCGLAEAG